MEIWLTRTLTGCAPADDEAERALKKHALGSTFPVEISTRKTRSGAWHRRYWVLCSMIASNVERVDIEPGLSLPIRTKDDAHIALKYLTGLFDTYALQGGFVRLLKSTAFDRMTADEWAEYWPRVLDAVHQSILPMIDIPALEDELARMAS